MFTFAEKKTKCHGRTRNNTKGVRKSGSHTRNLNQHEAFDGQPKYKKAVQGHSFSQIPLSSITPWSIQPKLTIGNQNDKYEKEADRIADEVIQMPDSAPVIEPQKEVSEKRIQRLCPQCRQRLKQRKPLNCPDCEENLQLKATIQKSTLAKNEVSAQTSTQLKALQGTGKPLSANVRQEMSQKMDADFRSVRVHTSSEAHQLNRQLGSLAFTHGSDIYFDNGKYDPGSTSGRHLLAHELVHTIQQQGQVNVLQRQPAKTQKRKNVVLLLSSDPDNKAKAMTLAPGATQIRVKSPEEMAEALKGITYPINRLFILAHSLPTGDLGFEGQFVRPETLAAVLQGAVPEKRSPKIIDFRGCSLGTSPSGMEKIRSALHAQTAIGSNCFLIHQVSGPIVIDDKAITKQTQVNNQNRKTFEKGLQMLIDSFGDAKGCILDSSEDAYFRANGKLVAIWASPSFSTAWDERKSKCYKDLSVKEVKSTAGMQDPGIAGHCKLIRIKEEPASKKVIDAK